jgi:hypothetical protein
VPAFEQEQEKAAPRPAGLAPLERGPDRTSTQENNPAGASAPELSDVAGLRHLQQTAGNAAVASMLEPSSPTPGDLVRSVVDSPGEHIDTETASVVSSVLGRDFSGVQVHRGPEAAASAQAVGAEMYASGQHVVAPRGLETRTTEGLFQTVHEFVHIGDQQDGSVDGTVTADGLKISDPSDRFEQRADAVAAQAVAERLGPSDVGAGEGLEGEV